LVGSLMYLLMHQFGHYYIQGVGYATIQEILPGVSIPLYLLVVVWAVPHGLCITVSRRSREGSIR
jgi:chloride channel protein, CIC family